MAEVSVSLGSRSKKKILKVSRMRLILGLCLLDVLGPVLVVLNYFGIPLMFLVNINQMLILLFITLLTQSLTKRTFPALIAAILITLISVFKLYLLSGTGNYNFSMSALAPFYFSLFMPVLIFTSIMSQKNDEIESVYQELYWFAKWYSFITIPLVLVYAIFYFTGQLSYFGLGINFHYFAPYFFQRYSHVLGFAILILLTGKRAVLLNFLVQFSLFFAGQMRRAPIKAFLVILISIAAVLIASGSLSILLRRFHLMYDALRTADLSGGLLGLANSYQALVLFGGRLEEIVGVLQYFNENPGQIWFGSPPGANFVWLVEQSDLETLKSFTHFTWLGYIFRYGIIPTFLLVSTFVYLGLKGANTQNPLWLVYVGVLTSATFGANLFYSPVSWTFIALYVRYGLKHPSTMAQNQNLKSQM